MLLKEAKEKAIKEIAACRKYENFSIWTNGNDFFIQQFVRNGHKIEFFGHVFKVDFDKKELIPVA